LSSIGLAHCFGAKLDWGKLLPGNFVQLPTYPFQRKRYWLESKGVIRVDIDSAGFESTEPSPLGAETSLGEEGDLRQRLATLPESEQLATLISIVQNEVARVLALSNVESIPAEKPLKELGLDSLMAVQLRKRLSALCQVELPATLVFEYPAPNDIAKLLLERILEEKLPSLLHSSKELKRDWSSLIEIQTRGSGRPFFSIHPIGGYAYCYSQLSYLLGEDRPFYGLQAAGLASDTKPDTSIEQMASRYIKELRQVQPNGPYLLGGWSMGGIIAFEMAQQLYSQGQEVEQLVMFDTFELSQKKPDNIESVIGLLNLTGLPINEEEFRRCPSRELLEVLMQHALFSSILSFNTIIERFPQYWRVFKSCINAPGNYRPKIYSGKITLIRCSEIEHGVRASRELINLFEDRTLGWAELSTEPIEVHFVNGVHHKMMESFYVEEVAEHLRKIISEQ
ncbi:MAG: thioesterase domain-containing protein, partial [Acidobacteriota bacterium]